MKKVLILALSISLTFNLTGCNLKNNETENSNKNKNNTVENNSDNTQKEINDKILTALEYFDTTKFDKSKFNGVLYDRDNIFHSVTDLLRDDSDNNVLITSNNVMYYSFSNNYYSENSAFYSKSDEYIYEILDVLGHPSTYMENYTDGSYGYSGSFLLNYNYGDYSIFCQGHDFRNWKDYNYKYPYISDCGVSINDNDFNLTQTYAELGYTVYGEGI